MKPLLYIQIRQTAPMTNTVLTIISAIFTDNKLLLQDEREFPKLVSGSMQLPQCTPETTLNLAHNNRVLSEQWNTIDDHIDDIESSCK